MNLATGGDQVRPLRQQPGLALVEHEPVYDGQRSTQLIRLILDPQVHRVADNQLGPRQLPDELALQRRVRVRQEHEAAVGERRRQWRPALRQHVELDVHGLGFVHGPGVLTVPAKRAAAVPHFHPARIYALLRERLQAHQVEILAHDAHHAHRREQRSRQRKINRRSAQRVLDAAKGRFDGIDSDGPGHEQRHDISLFAAERDARSARVTRAYRIDRHFAKRSYQARVVVTRLNWRRPPRSSSTIRFPSSAMSIAVPV